MRLLASAPRRLIIGVLAVAGLAWATESRPAADTVAPSTREMSRLLKERAAAVDPSKLLYVINDRRAEILARALEQPHGLAEEMSLRFQYATELTNAGRTTDALKVMADLQRDAQVINPDAWRHRGASMLLVLRAVAYMRMAEQQNCCDGNNADSCLLPIHGRGIHQKREGSTRAIEALDEVLSGEPDHLRARWLLNIAHMTLGSYPEGVPPRFLMPPATFASEYPLPRFDNVSKAVGLNIYGLSGGAILDDFDGDGRLDLMVSSIGFDDQLRLFHNEGPKGFVDATARAGLEGETGGLNLLQADYDNDGRVDALVLRGGWMGTEGGFPLSLLHNNGDGSFTDVTRAAGLLGHAAPTQTAVWFDFDGDGWLDLFVGNESVPDAIRPCELFHNNRDGTFTEMAHEAGVDVIGFVKGVASADYNNDGRPDLYLSLGGQENYLFRNDGPPEAGRPGWRFTNVAKEAGVTLPMASFPALFFDYDNDGWPDLYVGTYGAMAEDVAADYLGLPTSVERGRLYHNQGDGTFRDVTGEAGLYHVMSAMGMNFGDLDNDGLLDLYVGTGNPDLSSLMPKRMFRNADGKVFQDVTTAGDFGHLQKGHAICFGDVDNDGNEDVFEQLGGAYTADKAYSALYHNPGNANGWIGLELQGTRSNRSAIGARVKVTVETDAGPRSLFRTVGSGGSFGASPLRLDVGLGQARRIAAVEVFWPATGQTQAFEGLKIRHRYRVVEGTREAVEVKRPSFKLPTS